MKPSLCNQLIGTFDAPQNAKMHIRENRLTAVHLLSDRKDNPFVPYTSELYEVITSSVERYKKELEITHWPKKYGLEPPKMKRYFVGGEDRFDDHVDVDSVTNAMRFLVCFIYLSDNRKGSTVINPSTPDETDMYISRALRGSIVLFPPYWPWVHKGEAPVDAPKYIIGSYLHYVE